MKRFTLDKGTFKSPVLQIDQANAKAASAAKRLIIRVLTAEEKYDAVIENFLEFERDLLNITLDHQLFGGRSEDWFNTARNTIDRRFFNLLSTCRSYLEFAAHSSDEIPIGDDFKRERSRHFDESVAYQLMEGLRNQITYAGHAAHIITFSSSFEDIGTDSSMVTYVTPKLELQISRLLENPKLSKRLLKQLSELGANISFLPLLREYIRRLSEIHQFFRTSYHTQLASSRRVIEEIFTLFRDKCPGAGEFNGLLLREYDDEKKINEFWLIAAPGRIEYFESKNRPLSNLDRSRITNAVPT